MVEVEETERPNTEGQLKLDQLNRLSDYLQWRRNQSPGSMSGKWDTLE